jgi:hypothetical protein
MPFYNPGGGPVKLASGHSTGQGSYYSVWYNRLSTSHPADERNCYMVVDGIPQSWHHADGLVDTYIDPGSPNTVVSWNYNFGGSVFAVRSASTSGGGSTPPSTPNCNFTVRMYEAPDDNGGPNDLIPGTLEVAISSPQPLVGPLFYQLQNTGLVKTDPYVKLEVGSNPSSSYFQFQISNLPIGYYMIYITDGAPTPCRSSTQSPVRLTTSASPTAPCILELKDLATTPPTSYSQANGKVTGRIIGAGLASVRVQLLQDGQLVYTQDFQETGASNANYPFTLTGVLPGYYVIVAGTTPSAGAGARTVLDATNCVCFFPRSNTSSVVTVLPPDLRIGDQLTFLPWVQSALLNGIPAQTAQSTSLRPTLDLKATLAVDASTQNTLTVAATTAEIYGPGDVLGLNQRAILTTVPQPGAVGFSPLQLAAIDFKEEDLPWRYSMLTAPAVAATATTVALAAAPLPWCLLLVLEASEYDPQPLAGQPLPSIKVKDSATTPNLAYPSRNEQQQKLWAHVQINASLGSNGVAGNPNAVPPIPDRPPNLPTADEIKDFLNVTLPRNPDFAYSRVLCPRRLRQNTAYHAFLVPAIEAGRLAGLGREFDATHVRESSIPENTTEERIFPVYFQWQFTTGTEEDFESLVTELHPANASTSTATAPSLSVRTTASTYALPMPALLVDAAAAPPPATLAAQELAVAQYLHTELTPGRVVGGRPVVTPPLYGHAYMVSTGLNAPVTAVDNSWKHTLNLDPRYRALAALGAQVVQDNQEEYVRRAWEQVQDILLANEKLRGAQYGLRTTAGLRDQHLPLTSVVTTTTTSPTGATGSRTSSLAARPAAEETSLDGAATPTPGPGDGATTTSTRIAAGMADYGLHLTALALSRVRVSNATIAAVAQANLQAPPLPNDKITVREALRRSSTPLAAFSPTFRRIMKPFGNYQVGEAGRPLRPTQPEAVVGPNGLRQPGTSLRQRDTLLSGLVAGTLTAAPERAEQIRVSQFKDELVDKFLKAGIRSDGQPGLVLPAPPTVITDANARERFGRAYTAFLTQKVVALTPTTSQVTIVGFKKPQYVRPLLPLDPLKEDVVTGTAPGPLYQAKIKQVSPTVVPPVPLPPGDFAATDFNATDFYVGDFDELDSAPLSVSRPEPTLALTPTSTTSTRVVTPAAPAPTDAGLPIIKQAKVFPVFKDAMGEALRLRHPELFVPGLGDFPAGGLAVLEVNQAFIEAYMVGLNHALGSELLWRGFPVDLRGTFFQQFWNVSEHVNMQPPTPPTNQTPEQVAAAAALAERALLDIQPLDQWISNPLGTNLVAPAPSTLLRLAIRSELLRRYSNLVLALQLKSETTTDPARMLYPRQRLPVGQDLVVVRFDLPADKATTDYYLVLMERPGQPKFGLDELAPAADTGKTPVPNPLSWNNFSWEYLGTREGEHITISPTGRPHATAEPDSVAYLTDSATVAYALFQAPILATIDLAQVLR